MEKTHNILLNGVKTKNSVNENASLNVNFSGNKLLLPEDPISGTLNAYDIYLNEREKSNKFRLIINIKPYCSNVLFNPFTEIVKNEGSSSAICLNFLDNRRTDDLIENGYVDENAILVKHNSYYYIPNDFEWSPYEAIRDTQLSNNACGFDYHCGIDIFNNHILRSKSVKAVNYDDEHSDIEIGTLKVAYGNNYHGVKVNNNATPHVYLSEDFNTIDDYMRDKNGWIIPEHFPKIVKKVLNEGGGFFSVKPNLKTIPYPLHLYQKYDIMKYKECVDKKLKEENGWYGFNNPSNNGSMLLVKGQHTQTSTTCDFSATPYKIDCGDESRINITATGTTKESDFDSIQMSINKTINSRQCCDFIDMYPGRELYSFNPIYNNYRKREEKNWNYCLTYPYRNIIKNGNKDFPFLRVDSKNRTSLKVYMFDEGTYDDNGVAILTVYTICQHGLNIGDRVNIYKSDDLFYNSVEVTNVIDKYIFQVVKDSANMSMHWVEVNDRNVTNVDIVKKFKYNEEESAPEPQRILGGILQIGNKYYPICESNRCNVDPDAQDIHFRKVVGGVECEYYVRRFNRLPNFKYKDEEVNDFTLYDRTYAENNSRRRTSNYENLPLLLRYSNPHDPLCDFESHIGKMGFADTAYGDNTSEIVFTDDIDISYLKDNLGRPLNDVFLTIIKNNSGYKDWYGIDKQGINTNSVDVEFSHCFGKLNGSFLFSNYYRESYINNSKMNPLLVDARDLNANTDGLITSGVTDEINFHDDWEYNGDICCYSPVDCFEQIIQTAMYRFNTVQRELSDINLKHTSIAFNYFNNGALTYDEINNDENSLYDVNSDVYEDPFNFFKTNHSVQHTEEHLMQQREGYYYQPHYRIPFKTVSKSLNSDPAIEYEIVDVSSYNDNTFNVKTNPENNFEINSRAVLYRRSENVFYYLTVENILTSYRFVCSLYNENGEKINEIEGLTDKSQINDFVILVKHPDTPYYAKIIKDGSCRFYWRPIISNGMEDDPKTYPFTNGAFYVTQQINFFLRRQDPRKDNLGISLNETWDYNPEGEDIRYYPNFIPDDKVNFEEKEIEVC